MWFLCIPCAFKCAHIRTPNIQLAETALADEQLLLGDRLALQRRVLRLGKPPRRWKRPAWAPEALWEPREVVIEGRPLNKTTGVFVYTMGAGC